MSVRSLILAGAGDKYIAAILNVKTATIHQVRSRLRRDGHAIPMGRAGRRPGDRGTCGTCGAVGHYAPTCDRRAS